MAEIQECFLSSDLSPHDQTKRTEQALIHSNDAVAGLSDNGIAVSDSQPGIDVCRLMCRWPAPTRSNPSRNIAELRDSPPEIDYPSL